MHLRVRKGMVGLVSGILFGLLAIALVALVFSGVLFWLDNQDSDRVDF